EARLLDDAVTKDALGYSGAWHIRKALVRLAGETAGTANHSAEISIVNLTTLVWVALANPALLLEDVRANRLEGWNEPSHDDVDDNDPDLEENPDDDPDDDEDDDEEDDVVEVTIASPPKHRLRIICRGGVDVEQEVKPA